MEKKTVIFKPSQGNLKTRLKEIMSQIEDALKSGNNAVISIDIGEPCPICGGLSVDMGDSFRKQYGKTYRTCVDCMHCWVEGEEEHGKTKL